MNEAVQSSKVTNHAEQVYVQAFNKQLLLHHSKVASILFLSIENPISIAEYNTNI